MLIVTVMVLVIATIPLFGGRLRRLADIRLEGSYLLGMALAAQIAVISVFPGASERVNAVVHMATYGLAAAFVYRNRQIPGVLVIAAGGALNAFCITLNGGTLPARAAALEGAGIATTPGEFVNSGVLEDPKLWWLGDVFYVPGWLPVSNVFSIGDVIIVLGAAYGLHCLAQSRLTHVQIESRYDLPPLDDDLDLLLADDEVVADEVPAATKAAEPTAAPAAEAGASAAPAAEAGTSAAPAAKAGASAAEAGPEPSLVPFLAAAATASVTDDGPADVAASVAPDAAPALVPAPRPAVSVVPTAAVVTATSTVAWHDPALVAAVAADAGLTAPTTD